VKNLAKHPKLKNTPIDNQRFTEPFFEDFHFFIAFDRDRWAGDELATRDDLATQVSILHAQTKAKRLHFGRVAGGHRHHWNPCGATFANTLQCQGESTTHSVRQQFASARSWLAGHSPKRSCLSRNDFAHKRWLCEERDLCPLARPMVVVSGR
jgi:hypothetical protein